MLFEMIFKLLLGVVQSLVNIIPTFNMSADVDLGVLGTIFAYVNAWVSVSVIITIITIVVIRDNFTFLKNIFFAVMRKLPFMK